MNNREYENPSDHWGAPEHRRMSQDMVKDYPRDDYGRRIKGKSKQFVIDNRPTIMKPVTVPHVIDPKNRIQRNKRHLTY